MGLVLGTAGHIDHGKTALVRALTGVDTDRLPEEKARGITIDIGFAHLDLPAPDGSTFRVGIVDVPGHERFVRNMLAGAAGVDAALLVVAADDAVMPQTREHLAILRLLGVRHGLVAITKADLADDAWIDLVRDDVRSLLRGSFLQNAQIVTTSAATGRGIDDLRDAIAQCLARVPPRPDRGLFRMPVDRAFVRQGLGTIVTGTVWSGSVAPGDEVEWLPLRRSVRVRSVQSHGLPVDRARAGDRAALNLIGVHHSEIHRGHELAAPGYLLPTRRLTVRLHVLPESPWPLRHRARVRLHLAAAEVSAHVRLLQGQAVPPGGDAPAQLVCEHDVVAVCGQPFVLRAESPMLTIGGGSVLEPVARPIPRRRADLIARLPERAEDPDRRLLAALDAIALAPWSEPDLCREAGLEPDHVRHALDRLRAAGRLVALDARSGTRSPVLVSTLDRLKDRARRAIRKMHEAGPLLPTLATPRVVQRLAWIAGDEPRAAALLQALIDDGSVRTIGEGLALADFAPALSQADLALRDAILAAFDSAGLSPPSLDDLSRATGASPARVAQVIDLCQADGSLVRIARGFWLAASHERRARQLIAGALREHSRLTVAQIRDLLGTSRKYAVPLCEHFDAVGLTRRLGDHRLPGPAASIG